MFSTSSRILPLSRSLTYFCWTSSRTSTRRRRFSCLLCRLLLRAGTVCSTARLTRETVAMPSNQDRFQRDMDRDSSCAEAGEGRPAVSRGEDYTAGRAAERGEVSAGTGQRFSAPEGRPSLARGVSPWTPAPQLYNKPRRGGSTGTMPGTAAPPGQKTLYVGGLSPGVDTPG